MNIHKHKFYASNLLIMYTLLLLAMRIVHINWAILILLFSKISRIFIIDSGHQYNLILKHLFMNLCWIRKLIRIRSLSQVTRHSFNFLPSLHVSRLISLAKETTFLFTARCPIRISIKKNYPQIFSNRILKSFFKVFFFKF